MDLTGTGQRVTDAELADAARQHNLPVSRLHAIRAVEAPRGPFDARNRLTLLFEPHVFWRELPVGKRQPARRARLAAPRWREIPYGTFASQYVKLADAARIDRNAAVRSSSYGSFQTMGFNHARCGYPSAEAMIEAYKTGEAEQVRAALRFINADPRMMKALRAGDWATFSRLYNGAGYRKNRHHEKLAAADRMATARGSADPVDASPDKPDGSDLVVRRAQQQLMVLGYDVGRSGADGWMGPRTAAAVLKFQETHPDLHNDGRLGPQTLAALEKAVEHKQAASVAARKHMAGIGVGGAFAAITGGLGGGLLALIPFLAGVGFAAFAWWRHTQEFAWERQQIANIRRGISVAVAPWAERFKGDQS